MTRIIGGAAGGRRLQTPPGDRTRPTSDRVREALFSALEARAGSLSGLRVLDLYAGSGAVGLEAWSRGAAQVTLVERERATAALIRANADALGCRVATVLTGSVRTALARPPAAPFDLVFSDPPYSLPEADLAADLRALAENGWLTSRALVVVERGRRSPAPAWPPGLAPRRTRGYGETLLHYADHDPGPDVGDDHGPDHGPASSRGDADPSEESP